MQLALSCFVEMKNKNQLRHYLLLFFPFLFISAIQEKSINWTPQPKGFVYIPSGTMNGHSISAHWMSETEITNAQYREYLKDLIDSGYTQQYNLAYPDTVKIKSKLWVGGYGINYFTHPYFSECPVVNITPKQAIAYCTWLTKKHKRIYPSIVYPEFRLPTLLEWEYAAKGGRNNNYFTWGGEYMRNSRGCLLANFFNIDDKYMYLDTGQNHNQYTSEPYLNYYWNWQSAYKAINETNSLRLLHLVKKKKYVFYGLPIWADAYFPNDFGMYNMCGNAAEIVLVNDSARCVGGSYKTTGAYLRLDLLLDHHRNETWPFEDVGFRVVVDYKKLN